MDKGQESTSQAGSSKAMDILSAELPDDTSATKSRIKEAMDILSQKLADATADADSSQESKTCTASEGHLLAARHSEKKHTQDDESWDETAMSLHKFNIQLEQDNEMLRERIKQRKDVISKVNAEIDARRKLKDSALNTERSETAEGLDLDKAVEGLDRLTHKR